MPTTLPFREVSIDLTLPSCKFLREATISLIELEPKERLRDFFIGDMGGDSEVGVAGGETDTGEDRKAGFIAQDDSNACPSPAISSIFAWLSTVTSRVKPTLKHSVCKPASITLLTIPFAKIRACSTRVVVAFSPGWA